MRDAGQFVDRLKKRDAKTKPAKKGSAKATRAARTGKAKRST